MRIGSLFAGIGGLELGLERSGVGHTVWQVEKDPYCRQVLARHWPDAVRYEDVTTVDWSAVEPVEVLCGGFPCQPFSLVGAKLGVADERWMWPAFADAVRHLRPRFVVLENVAALVRFTDAWGWVLRDLWYLGFDVEWSVLSACSVGAPHRRRRLYAVAYPARIGLRTGRYVTGRSGPAPAGQQTGGTPRRASWWASEPDVGRVAYGLPDGVVRRRALGNAVVPQVAEVVGRRLMELAA